MKRQEVRKSRVTTKDHEESPEIKRIISKKKEVKNLIIDSDSDSELKSKTKLKNNRIIDSDESKNSDDDSDSGKAKNSDDDLSEDSDVDLPTTVPSLDTEVVRFEMSQENSVSFHHLIEYLKRTNDEGNLIFSKSGISYRATGRKNTVFNCFQLSDATSQPSEANNGDQTKYEYRSNKHSIVAGIVLETLQKFTRVGKKNRLVLSIYRDEDFLHVKQISSNKEDLGIDCIKLKDVNEEPVFPGEFPKKENCSVSMPDFIDACKAIVSIKSKKVTVRAFPKGILLYSQLDGGLATKVRPFGICDNPVKVNLPDYLLDLEKIDLNRDEETSTKVASSSKKSDELDTSPPNKVLKKKKINVFRGTDISIETGRLRDLTQIAKIDLKGDVRLTLAEDLPLRIACDIGDMGVLEIYLRDITHELENLISRKGSSS
jgi:hypothetical protein